jgi:hypothetical protein
VLSKHAEVADWVRRRNCYIDVAVMGVKGGDAKDGALSVAQLNRLTRANRSTHIKRLPPDKLYGRTLYQHQYPIRQTKNEALRYLDGLVGDGVDVGLTHIQITTELITDSDKRSRRLASHLAYHIDQRWRGRRTVWIERRHGKPAYYFARADATRNLMLYATTSKVDGCHCVRVEVERSYFTSMKNLGIERPRGLLRADIALLFSREFRLSGLADPAQFELDLQRLIEEEAREAGRTVQDMTSEFRKLLFREGQAAIDSLDEHAWLPFH